MRRPHAAAFVLLLWLAVLTVAFHGCRRLGCGGLLVATPTTKRTTTGPPVVAVTRKMLLSVTSSFDAAASPTNHPHHHHHNQHHHPHRHHHHHHHHRHVGRWNRQGIPPSPPAGDGEQVIDPRYDVEKRLVPTGPNPLHH